MPDPVPPTRSAPNAATLYPRTIAAGVVMSTASTTAAGTTTSAVARALRARDPPRRREGGTASVRATACGVVPAGPPSPVWITQPLPQLSVWNPGARRQEVPRGGYRLAVGPDSATATLPATLQATADATPKLQTVTVQPPKPIFSPGETLDLTADNPWITDDTPQAAQHVKASHVVEAANSDQTFLDLKHARITV